MNRKTITIGCFPLIALCAMTGSVNAANVPSGTVLAQQQVLIRNNGSEPATLDPHKAESDVEFNIINDIFDGLVAVGHDGTIEPRLAVNWENRDNTVWIFHLRKGLTWSNGVPITAGDIVWSWRRLVNPQTTSPYASYLGAMHVANAADIADGKKAPDTLGVNALDDNTLEITLTQPVAAFLNMLAHPSLVPLDKTVIERFGERWTRPEHIVSNGAYQVKAWSVNEKIVGERNKRYWDDEHTVINNVTWLAITSQTADINRYKSGEIDITYSVPINQYVQLKKTLGDQVRTMPQLATYYYQFNTTRPPFNDPRVRRALNMGLDKDIIAEKVLGQGQRPAWIVSSQEIGGITLHNPEYASWPREKRLTEARKLLNDAGFNKQHPLQFNLLYNTRESHQRIAIAASSMWKKNLGVTVRLQNQEWKTLLDTLHTGNFDVVRYAWIADYDDAASFLNNFTTGNSGNTSRYSNAVYDEVLSNAAKASDTAIRGKYYQQAEDILSEEVPSIPVYHYVRSWLVKPWVGGFQPDSQGRYATKDLWIEAHAVQK